ncbi:MAG: sugar-binding domain-containing protein [bacterium]
MSETPFNDKLKTNERAARPRPDWMREKWLSLDGEWEFQTSKSSTVDSKQMCGAQPLKEKIIVPFCVEAKASGIGSAGASHYAWYKKRFELDPDFTRNRRVLLNFGAVDYEARVWLNGKLIGSHTGGYTPFRFDITDALKDGGNVLTVRVFDTHDPRIPRGKQTVLWKPVSIFYTTVTGIWQPVYLESVGQAYLASADIRADLGTGLVSAFVEWNGAAAPAKIRLTADLPGGGAICFESDLSDSTLKKSFRAEFNINEIEPWSPDSPHLYPLKIELLGPGGAPFDSVETYFAFRSIAIKDKSILLNGKPLYQKLLLNQGYFPEGHYTPADPSMFRTDVEQAKEMGFNGARMHQKIEDPRFHFWCDALGFLLWEEMPSALCFSKVMKHEFKTQWREAIARDRNHPCIITWVPFNESWGIKSILWSESARKYVEEMYLYTKELDPTRPVIDNSGFEHVRTDILDLHHYLGTAEKANAHYEKLRNQKNMRFDIGNMIRQFDPAESPVCALAPGAKYEGQPMLISEYGGFGFYKTQEKPLIDNFRDYTLGIARCDLFQGFCYTQQYDTEQEQNGLLTFDRKTKIPAEEIQAVNLEVDRIVAERAGSV